MRPYSVNPNPAFGKVYDNKSSTRKIRKACTACARSKIRCDLQKPSCSGCNVRRRTCTYQQRQDRTDCSPCPSSSRLASGSNDTTTADLRETIEPVPNRVDETVDAPSSVQEGPKSKTISYDQYEGDFLTSEAPRSDLNLTLRWLWNGDSADGGGRDTTVYKSLSRSTRYFCSKFIAALPFALLFPGKTHPIIHESHIGDDTYGRLANAIKIIRSCRSGVRGSENLLADVLTREMEAIVNDNSTESPHNHLAAFQSFLMLILLLYYHLPPALASQHITLGTLVDLQMLANRADHALANATSTSSASVNQGVSTRISSVRDQLPDDPSRLTQHKRFILAESLRRAIFVACIFDNIWNSEMGFQVVMAGGLRYISAPCSKQLWIVQDDRTWAEAWRRHSQIWSSAGLSGSGLCENTTPHGESNIVIISFEDPGLRLEEIWGREDDPANEISDARFDQWMLDVDEYGMWLFAVCEMMGNGRSRLH